MEVILSWPEPTSIQYMQQFLGVSVHLKGFIDGYAKIGAPLTDLISKKARFPMNADARHAFEQLKAIVASTTVMALPDLLKPFIVPTDASDVAIGAVLQQKGRNVSFLSRKLQGAERTTTPMTKKCSPLFMH